MSKKRIALRFVSVVAFLSLLLACLVAVVSIVLAVPKEYLTKENLTYGMIFISAVLATFVASVMADEQNDRLRKGAFGAIAGSSMGGFAAMLKNDPTFFIIGLFGSSLGAVFGWFTYLGLSCIACFQWGRRLLEYHVNGISGVREQLELDDRRVLLSALESWANSFRRSVLTNRLSPEECTNLVSKDQLISDVIMNWLISATDVFNLVLEYLARKPEYHLRVTIIVYGLRDGKVVGKHWLSYAGLFSGHRSKEFNELSIGYKVLSGERDSPCFSTWSTANKEGQNRKSLDSQEGPYKSFITFQINQCAVLSIDWPGELKPDDPYVKIARDFYFHELNPIVADLLTQWSKPLEREVQLDELRTSTCKA